MLPEKLRSIFRKESDPVSHGISQVAGAPHSVAVTGTSRAISGKKEAPVARQSRGLVLAGLFGETSCLATLIDGHSRSHAFTFLADASVSLGYGSVAAGEMHHSVGTLASVYSDVALTHVWVDRMSRRIGAAS